MSRLRRPPAEIAELRQRREELSRQLAVLQKERDLETRAADKLAQDAALEERKARLREVESELEPVELVEKADELERKQSWAAAIATWEKLALLFPDELEPASALGRLRAGQELQLRLDQVLAGVMPRRHELGELWPEVRASLQEMRSSGRANEEALILIGELIAGKLDAAAFGRDWRSHGRELRGKAGPPGLFYSYAREDESLRDELAKHLKLLERQGILSGWHDRSIVPGTDWNGVISQQLLDAEIILLLVSADFLASDYIWGQELKVALERHRSGEARVVPIILRPCDWKNAPFAHLQGLPRDGKPIAQWRSRDEAFASIAEALRQLAGSLKSVP